MKSLRVQKYNAKHKDVWDEFVLKAEVHSILFFRDFMEYHRDRFIDYSLMMSEDRPGPSRVCVDRLDRLPVSRCYVRVTENA